MIKISENDIATLRNDRELRRTSVYGSDIVYGILDYFEARQNELLEANNRYLERARKAEAGTLEAYLAQQIEWSRDTFGPALRTRGVIDHIRKELGEIEEKPHDLSEWVDVVILALDGFWRHGGEASGIMPALIAKQQKNMSRFWPDWKNMSEHRAIEHDRSAEAPKPCGIQDPTARDCPNMKEAGGGMSGERYSCVVCGKGYFLNYEEMK